MIYVSTWLGKIIQLSMSWLKSGGQALPGLIIERFQPSYLAKMLHKLPEGVVVITGTNGKTTTSKMIVELLTAEGKKVLSNPTGSNLTRGIVSGLLAHASWSSKLDYDIAVLELDEAFAIKFIARVKPEWVVALNVSRDQLDRFGEVDKVARLVGTTMKAASRGVITNANDPHLSTIGQAIADNQIKVSYFGVSPALRQYFPNDKELVSVDDPLASQPTKTKIPSALVELTNFQHQNVTYKINNQTYSTNLKLNGQHNYQNAAAALALVIELLPATDPAVHVDNLAKVSVAFGRGESFKLPDGTNLQLVLVKNPASFRQALASYLFDNPAIMIAINDNYADSRDVSWLWDVDFSTLSNTHVSLTSGSRAADMALRLSYDDIKVNVVENDLNKALNKLAEMRGDKIIFATYTAMLQYYAILNKRAGVNP